MVLRTDGTPGPMVLRTDGNQDVAEGEISKKLVSLISYFLVKVTKLNQLFSMEQMADSQFAIGN